MKSLIKIWIMACCMLAIIPVAAFANCNMKKNMTEPGKMGQEMMGFDKSFCYKAGLILENSKELSLSKDQIEKIHVLKYNIKKSMIKQDANIESLMLDIKEALRKDEVDLVAIDKFIDEKHSLKAKKAKEIVRALVDLKKILNEEQREQLKEICQNNRNEGMKEMMQNMKHGKKGMPEKE